MAIEEYRSGVLSKEEVVKMLDEACGVKAVNDLSWMLPHVEKGIREIIGEKACNHKERQEKQII